MLKSIRNAVWRRASSRCEHVVAGARCNRWIDRANWEGHVHHVVYRGHGKERLEDLELRCLACHGAAHPQHAFHDRATQEAIARVRREARGGPRSPDRWAGVKACERRTLSRGRGRWAWCPA